MTAEEYKPSEDSRLLGISSRGWIAFTIIATMCMLSALGREVPQVLESATLIAMGFYFGQKGN